MEFELEMLQFERRTICNTCNYKRDNYKQNKKDHALVNFKMGNAGETKFVN